MANLGGTFDATSVEPNAPFETIPAGKYLVQVIASEVRPTKSGDGQYLWLEMEILEGEYQGRKLWDRLNLWNQNQQAVDIAQRTLSAMCHAIGKMHVENSEELHFVPMVATVRVRPARDGYDASNEIRGYETASGGQTVTPPSAQAKTHQQPSQRSQSAPAASRPWAQTRRVS